MRLRIREILVLVQYRNLGLFSVEAKLYIASGIFGCVGKSLCCHLIALELLGGWGEALL